MPTGLKTIQAADPDLNRVQQALIPPLNALIQHPLLDGRLTEVLKIPAAAGGLTIEHKLGREPRGWFVVNADKLSEWAELLTGNPDRTKFLQLLCSTASAVNLQLYVF